MVWWRVGSATSLLGFSDISRVEVLRGPQGMLFGKNASAGVLNITTNDPTEEFEGRIGLSYADENEIKVNGAVSGPLSGNVLGRLSFYSNTRDGIYENVFPGGEDGTDHDEWGVRGKLKWDVNDDLEAKNQHPARGERKHQQWNSSGQLCTYRQTPSGQSWRTLRT